MSRKLASIDLGTHTARLLVAEWDDASHNLLPIVRHRTYVHLGSAFQYTSGGVVLSMAATSRVVGILQAFKRPLHEYGVKTTIAIATGVIRQAQNRDDFLGVLREETGIDISVVSGEDEARLTATAVHHALDMGNKPHGVVDLGGGSTEFVVAENDQWWVRSLALGASVLTENYLKTDPPGQAAVSSLRKFVRQSLMNGLDRAPSPRVFSLVGTGGTIVTLGATLHGIPLKKLDPDHVNGLEITRGAIREFFAEMITLKQEERMRRYGLDGGRAGVFPAGVLLATEIMNFFSMDQLTVCFSDLLEGLLWEQVEDSEYAQ